MSRGPFRPRDSYDLSSYSPPRMAERDRYGVAQRRQHVERLASDPEYALAKRRQAAICGGSYGRNRQAKPVTLATRPTFLDEGG